MNLTAPISSLGYGKVGTQIALALHKYVPVALWLIGPAEADNQDEANLLQRMIHNTTCYDPSAPSIRIYHQFDLAQHVGKGEHIGFPIFELNKFTSTELHHLKCQDVLFVASKWAVDILHTNRIHTPSVVIPFGASLPSVPPTPRTDTFTFLNIGKWEIRKGHDFLLEAFNKAFSPTDNVRLDMLCYNPVAPNTEVYNRDWERSYMNSKMGLVGKIRIVPRLRSAFDVAKLIDEADCGVFPSRAEGWNMGLAEMMSAGKHCITTNCTAHTEYCNEDVCDLIEPGPMEEAFDGVWFNGQGEWASLGEAQLEQAITYMRKLYDTRMGKGGLAKAHMNEKFTWDNTAKAIMEETYGLG